jgi:hypothetical protein
MLKRAILCRYAKHHRPLRECSALAQRVYERLRIDPQATGSLREELKLRGRPERNRFNRALQELQVTLNIARPDSRLSGFSPAPPNVCLLAGYAYLLANHPGPDVDADEFFGQ